VRPDNHVSELFARRRPATLILAALALLSLFFVTRQPVLAACGSPTVVSTEAELEAAIIDFNSQAGPCSYTIELDADITLSTNLSAIDNTNAGVELTLDGAGFTIDGDRIVGRILEVDQDTSVTLLDVTLQNSDGFGVFTNGDLTIRGSTVRDNVFDPGILHAAGSLLVADSALVNNFAGIISFGDTLTVVNSTIANSSNIGVLAFSSATVTLTNVTVAGNDNGLVAEDDATMTVDNSLIAHNEDADCQEFANGSVTFRHSLLERTDSEACGLPAANPDANGNIVGEQALLAPLGAYGGPTQTIPQLSLTGSVTLASPGIDSGSNALAVDETAAPLTFDQRGAGFPRIVNSTVDMGAVEGPVDIVCPAFPISVATEAELTTAIVCYNALTTPGVYTIILGADIALNLSTTVIDNDTAGVSLVIDGDNRTLDGQDTPGVRPIFIAVDTTVTINDATLTGGNTTGISPNDGGAVYNRGTLTLNRVIIDANRTPDNGGGLYNDDGATVTLNNSVVSNNRAEAPNGDGGGINNEGSMEIIASAIVNNQTFGDSGVLGGGIFNEGVMTITGSLIDGNSITIEEEEAFGAGILNEANLTIRDSTISNNTVQGEEKVYGGGIASYADYFAVVDEGYGSQLTIINSTISGNTATAEFLVYGGGLYVVDYRFGDCCAPNGIVPVTIINSTLSDNAVVVTNAQAGTFGGGGAYFVATETTASTLQVTIDNSILANSTTRGVAGDDCVEIDTAFDSNYSLYEDTDLGACGLPAANPDGDGNIVGVDPVLGPLQNNGGPTETHLPLAGSPALDSGSNALALDPINPLTADQRGFTPRIVNGTVERGSVEVGAVAGFCPVDNAAVDTLRTDLIGVGMGSPTMGARSRKLTVPNYQDVDSLYGQLAAVDVGIMKYVRFLPQGSPTIQIHAPTSPAYRPSAVDWWGTDLPAVRSVIGRFFWGQKGNRAPRAFVLWPTYRTAESYANVLAPFDESSENHVYWDTAGGWIDTQTQVLSIPPTQAAGASITVNVAVVDVNKDARSVILTVEAGGVSETRVITVPNRKSSLNIETFTLAGVPAGTDEVTITLESPPPGEVYPFGGDSAAMIGAAVNYPCEIASP
jgi:hypothetical protein